MFPRFSRLYTLPIIHYPFFAYMALIPFFHHPCKPQILCSKACLFDSHRLGTTRRPYVRMGSLSVTTHPRYCLLKSDNSRSRRYGLIPVPIRAVIPPCRRFCDFWSRHHNKSRFRRLYLMYAWFTIYTSSRIRLNHIIP